MSRRTVAVTVVAATLAAMTAASSASVARPGTGSVGAAAGTLTHAGRWLTDARGRVVTLHGIGVMNYSPPSTPAALGFGPDDAAFLAAHGFNYVRVGMNWSAAEPSPGRIDEAYLRSIASTVRALGRRHIYSLLDWHQDDWGVAANGIDGAPAWATQNGGLPNPSSQFAVGYFADLGQDHAFDSFWNNAPGPGGVGLQDRFLAMLTAYGRAFRRMPYLLGYELFNEPFPGTQWEPCASPQGCPAFDTTLARFYRRAIATLRAADPAHLVFYEPNIFYDFGADTTLQNADGGDARTGFAFHDYCLGSGAGAAFPPIPASGQGCSVEEPMPMKQALAYSQRTGAVVLNSEWAASGDPAMITRMTSEFNQYMLGWLFWLYNAPYFVADPHKPPTGANVDGAVVSLLDQPYPQSVAGTPQSWSWDPQTSTFTLTYSTRAPAGVHLAPGSTTDVWVGKVHFPHGYRVHVTNASIVSSPASTVLRLVACPGAIAVTVSVTPTGHTSDGC